LEILIGVVPVGVGIVGTTTAGVVAVGTTTGVEPVETTGVAGVVGVTVPVATGTLGVTTGVELDVLAGTTVVTTGAGVVGTLAGATGVADGVELLEDDPPPPPPETIGVAGAELSTGTGVLVLVVVLVVDFAFRSIFIASILFLRSESTVALTRVRGAIVVALTLRIACTNERDFLFAFADRTIALASTTFCL
jgi:hypothetical protein